MPTRLIGPGEFAPDARDNLAENIDFTKPMSGGPVDCGFDTYFGEDVPNFPPYTWFEQDRLVDQPTGMKPDEMLGWPGVMAPGWKLDQVMPELTRRSVKYIEDSGEAPFFLYFPLTAPHEPIVPTSEFEGRSGAGRYGDYVCEVDWSVGEVMSALERKGIADDTLIIFASDNGPENPAYERAKEHGHYSMAHLRGIKRDTWEGGHRIPFVARWPGVTPPGGRSDRLGMLGDFIATCADLVGAELPADAAEDSVSILPLLRGEDVEVRDFVVHHSSSGRFAVRKGDWVLIDHPTGDDNCEPEWFREERGVVAHDQPRELFNLRDDIAELRNLYAERPDVARELGALLAKVKEACGSRRPLVEDDSMLSE